MMRGALIKTLAVLACVASGSIAVAREPAITAFNAACFNKGYSAERIVQTMEAATGAPVSFELTFWDKTLAPAPNTSDVLERRCKVAFAGDHTKDAVKALRVQMDTPPVFGTAIPLTPTHSANAGTALIEARELLVGRIAVVHVGTQGAGSDVQTFMTVDRLPTDWRERLK